MLFSKSLITRQSAVRQYGRLATAWLLVQFIRTKLQLYSALSYLQETSNSIKFG